MRSQVREAGTWLQHLTVLAWLSGRPIHLYESKPLRERGGGGEGKSSRYSHFAVFHPRQSHSFSAVAQRCGLLVKSRAEWAAGSGLSLLAFLFYRVMNTLPIALTTDCPESGSPLHNTCWLSVGARSPLWSLPTLRGRTSRSLWLACGLPQIKCSSGKCFHSLSLATRQ